MPLIFKTIISQLFILQKLCRFSEDSWCRLEILNHVTRERKLKEFLDSRIFPGFHFLEISLYIFKLNEVLKEILFCFITLFHVKYFNNSKIEFVDKNTRVFI